MKQKNQKKKGGFFGMLLSTLAASLLGNMLADKPKIPGQGVIREGEGTIRAGEGAIRVVQDF